MLAAAGVDWQGDAEMTIKQNARAIVDHDLRAAVDTLLANRRRRRRRVEYSGSHGAASGIAVDLCRTGSAQRRRGNMEACGHGE